MQAYGSGFARVYNRVWAPRHARMVGPAIRALYEDTAVATGNRMVLDVCCGGGHVARSFLDWGYSVVGIDLSSSQLEWARRNAAEFVTTGQARFVLADATDFSLERQFGLAVATYDSLNHLDGMETLRRCLACILGSVVEGGTLVFDLNTRRGLAQRWNGFSVRESNEELVLSTAVYDGQSKAFVRFWGFMRLGDGTYERFEQFTYNTAYDLDQVLWSLLDIGWHDPYVASVDDLSRPVADPESLERAFVVATA